MNTKIHLTQSLHQKNTRQSWRRLLPVFALFLLVTMACNFSLGGPKPPEDRPTVQPGQTTDWRSVIANAKPGDNITLTFTENDLTAVLTSAMQSQVNQDFQINNPKVILRNGQMEIYGQAITSVVTANFRVNMVVKVDSSEKPHMEITSADFGGIPVPDSLQQTLQERLDQALNNAIENASAHFKTQQVTITDGLMTINGTVQ